MNDRRDFLKASILVAAGVATSSIAHASAPNAACPSGLIYTAATPGHWAGKEKSHAPIVSREGNKFTITTAHPMSEAHYIVRHTLVADSGEVLGAKTFYPNDAAVSVFEVEKGKVPKYATSFCNQHDFWMTEI